MGAWGTAAFDNDSACDWAYNLEEVDDLSVVEAAIDAALAEEEHLDADLGCEALAACEVLARLGGRWGKRTAHTEAADQWVERHAGLGVPADLRRRAGRVIDRVLADGSELRGVWDESDDAAGWRASVEDLRRRVEG
jgi:hypothetical protein